MSDTTSTTGRSPIKILKYIVIVLAVAVIIISAIIIHRLFFQFKTKDVNAYINDEAEKYQDKNEAYRIIHEGVQYILSSHNLTQQVLNIAKANKSTNEQELVHAAINQCKAFKYLPE